MTDARPPEGADAPDVATVDGSTPAEVVQRAVSLDEELAGHIVALLFAADGPVSTGDLARILEARRPAVERALRRLVEQPPLGLLVQRHGDQTQLVTAPASAPFVRRLRGLAEHTRLSRAALEVLAVIAYRQPVTRAEIEAIRGVNGDRALTTLLTRGLVEEVGRKETVGRPVLFGTTFAFLEQLGLPSLEALPKESGEPLTPTQSGHKMALRPPLPQAGEGEQVCRGGNAAPESAVT